MSKLSQVQATYNAITNVLSQNDIPFRDYQEQPVSSVFTSEMRKQVISILAEGFRAGTIEMKDTDSNKTKLQSESELNKYVGGLVTNWLNKDKRLNGNVSHKPKNPGSKGNLKYATEEEKLQIKAMQHILKEHGEDEQVRAYLTELQAKISARKPKSESKVDLSVLPEELRVKFENA